MPGWLDGIALARQWRTRAPSMRILLASGYLVFKPYRKADLALRMRSILERQDPPGDLAHPAATAEDTFHRIP